ncbi:SusF/SusE family outer membrane protein [Cellvibrio sp.]
MKNVNFVSKATNKLILLSGVLSLLMLTACGGGSGGGYNASDNVDRAPYFSVAGSAVKNGASIDASKTTKMPIELFDDKALKSYHVTIDGETVAQGDISGTTAVVEVDLAAYSGDQTYSAKVLAVDSSNHSTVAYFTLNVKEFYEQLSLIGSATPAGWDTSAAVKMTVDPTNNAIFTWTGPLTPGEFKISTQETVSWDSGYDWIHPLTNGQSLASSDYQVVVSGGADNKWVIPEGQGGTYTITVNQVDKQIWIGKPLARLYVVGSATPIGWNLGNAMQFERNSDNIAKFTLTLALGAGEFKISEQRDSWEVGNWIYAPTESAPFVIGSSNYDLRLKSDPDAKWVVSGAQAGTYKLTIDLDAGTILAELQ